MRTAVYLRISLDRTGEELAVSRQREVCRRIAAERGWEVIDEYIDNSISASDKRKARPGYDRLVTDYAAGRFDALICWDLDRLTRQPRQLEDWIDAAEERGLRLVTANGEADLSNDNGRMFARIKASIAKGEVERKSARQKLAAEQLAKSGRPNVSGRPFGYEPGLTAVRDSEAALLREAYADVLAGASVRGIAARWNAAGVKTSVGGRWRGGDLAKMLRHPRYAGIRTHGQGRHSGSARLKVLQEVGPAVWPGVIDEPTFRAVVAVLTDPTRRTNPGSGRKHLLSGIARCAICDQTVVTGIRHDAGGRWDYECKEMLTGSSRHVSRAGQAVDDLIVANIIHRLSRPDAADLLVDDDTSDLAALRDEEQTLSAHLKVLTAELANPGAAVTALRSAVEATHARLADVRAQMVHPDRATTLTALIGSDIESVAVAWHELPLDRRRVVIDLLLGVRLLPCGGAGSGRLFRPDSVEIEWRVDGGTAPATRGSAVPIPASTLLKDLIAVLGDARVPASKVPALLAAHRPSWPWYRVLNGYQLRDRLIELGVKMPSTSNRWPVSRDAVCETAVHLGI